MIEIVMEVDDEFWNIINQLTIFKEQKEIIHCKDCKYNGREEDVEWIPEDIACEYWAIDGFDGDDFCSRGERK